MTLLYIRQVLFEIVPATIGFSFKPEAKRMRRILLKNPDAAIGCAEKLLEMLQSETPPQRVFCRTAIDPHCIALQMLNQMAGLPPKALPRGDVYTSQFREIMAAYAQIRNFPLWFAPCTQDSPENLLGFPTDVSNLSL